MYFLLKMGIFQLGAMFTRGYPLLPTVEATGGAVLGDILPTGVMISPDNAVFGLVI